MKVSVRTENDYAARVARVSTPSMLKTQIVRAICELQFDKAEVRFGEPNGHRPYLYLSGYIAEAKGDFPCGINQIVFNDRNDDNRMSFRLEFTKDEIKTLVDKGLYDVKLGEFECPDIFTDTPFTLGDSDGNIGIDLKCSYIAPEKDGDAPILFVGVIDQHREAFADDTGYTDPVLSAYFDEFKSPWFEDMASLKSRGEMLDEQEEAQAQQVENEISNADEPEAIDDQEYPTEPDYTDDEYEADVSNEFGETDIPASNDEDDMRKHMDNIIAAVENKIAGNVGGVDDDEYDDEDDEAYDEYDEYEDEYADEPVGRKPVQVDVPDDDDYDAQMGE